MKYPITYMLDTNTFSFIASGRSPRARKRFKEVHGADIVVISAITAAELHFGMVKKPEAVRVRQSVQQLMDVVPVLAWDEVVALEYGQLRAAMTKKGTPMAAMDLLIAAHAASIGAVLVTGDLAFRHTGNTIVNWADDV